MEFWHDRDWLSKGLINMPIKYSSAFIDFRLRCKEVKALANLARTFETFGDMESMFKANALIRSATVLLSSHIQGYVEILGVCILQSMIDNKVKSDVLSDNMRFYLLRKEIKSIHETKSKIKLVEKIRNLHSEKASKILNSNFIDIVYLEEDHKYGFANPKYDEIKNYISRFGFSSVDSALKSKLASRHQILINILDTIVDRRNKIAHGDYQATFTVIELESYIASSDLIVSHIDRSCTNWFRTKGCRFW
jgi:hypothetical protein